ncbi:MAG: efflux RND transporter permease subunit, partial [Gemmatimonadota bacterium]
MWLIRGALRRPVTAVVCVLAVLMFGVLALRGMAIDILPRLGSPIVYVAQPYGGLSPAQMEGFVASYYEYHFLYVTGIRDVESRSIQGVSLLKLRFHDGTDMNQAMAEVIGYVNRARAFMPPGTVPPFVVRYDAGSAPVGQLVLRSESRSLGEIQDLALFRVRPMFAALQGVSAPPPFGGNQRTVVVRVDPERLRSYALTPDAVVQTLARGNAVAPAGNVRIGDYALIANQNTIVADIAELGRLAVKVEGGVAVRIGDVATVENGSDIATSYALVNGRRSIYIPVTKRSDASTWDVVQRVRAALPAMQAAVPGDIKISYEFDQSGYVLNALRSLMLEAGLGALLTGAVVLLFLRDWRSAAVVVVTIPIAILAAAIGLAAAGQTINVMTLSGLALAVGILVDQATVTVENIHRHFELGESKQRAIFDACREIIGPEFLILASMLAVFAPAAFMSGTPRAMFLPLSLAVGFAMIASFVLSQTLVPVLANWTLR